MMYMVDNKVNENTAEVAVKTRVQILALLCSTCSLALAKSFKFSGSKMEG